MDNTVGPLAYLVAPPGVTTKMNTSFVRPVTADVENIEIEAIVTAQTHRQLFLSAYVTNMAGKLSVVGQAINQLIEA